MGRGERSGVAVNATGVGELRLAVLGSAAGGSGSWRIQPLNKVLRARVIAGEHLRQDSRREVGDRLRYGVEEATRGLVDLRGVGLVGDAHFHVHLQRGHQQRRAHLRLPSEALNAAIVAAVIRMSCDPERCLLGEVRIHVVDDGDVAHHFDQPISVGRSHLAKHQIAFRRSLVEVRLRKRATRSVGAALNREQLMYVSVRDGRARLIDKACFQDRTG